MIIGTWPGNINKKNILHDNKQVLLLSLSCPHFLIHGTTHPTTPVLNAPLVVWVQDQMPQTGVVDTPSWAAGELALENSMRCDNRVLVAVCFRLVILSDSSTKWLVT